MDQQNRVWGQAWIREGLAQLDGWKDLVEDLVRMGYRDEEIQDLLKPYGVWSEEARAMKAAGYPFEEILDHLRDLKAQPWDLVRALVDNGQSLADTLRLVLSSLKASEERDLVDQLLEVPEEDLSGEAQAVLAYHGLQLE